jgi:hypothetical protein
VNKCVFILLFFVLIGLSGCQTNTGSDAQKPADMNPEDLPDVRAFQDEFTREFLQSTEETRDGYYPFLSGTGRYEMDFPGGGVIGEKSYALKDDGIENLVIGTKMDDGGMQIRASYNITRNKERVDRHLDRFEKNVEEDLSFEEIVLDDRSLYLAEYFPDAEDDYYVAYIQNQLDGGGVELRFTIDHSVSMEKSTILEEIKSLAESVQFVNETEK